MRRDNVLVLGEPRLGWVYLSGGSDAVKAAAMLRDTGSSIELTLPLNKATPDGHPYYRRWLDGVMHMNDPDRSEHSYTAPRVLIFPPSGYMSVIDEVRSTHAPGPWPGAVGKGLADQLSLSRTTPHSMSSAG